MAGLPTASTGSVGALVNELQGAGQAQPQQGQQQPMVLVPAGLIGDLLGSVASGAGGLIGGAFGQQQLGQQLGGAASPFLRMLPFSAGPPAAQPQQGQQQQPMVLVPAGILGSFLGGAGGGALGNFVGGLFGNPELGRTIGSTGGGVLGGLLPFSVVPVS